MALYIYRVGRISPAKNPFYRYIPKKISNCTQTPTTPVRPVDLITPATRFRPVKPTGQTSLSLSDRLHVLDRSDYLGIPVRPVIANFGHQHMPPYFLVMLAWQKNKPLDQNCLRTMINVHRQYFVLRAINIIGHILLLLQADDETTHLGLHTCMWFPTLLVQPPLVVPWTPSCASVAAFFFGCVTSLSDPPRLKILIVSLHTLLTIVGIS